MKLFEKKGQDGNLVNISIYTKEEWEKLSEIKNSGYQIIIDNDSEFSDDGNWTFDSSLERAYKEMSKIALVSSGETNNLKQVLRNIQKIINSKSKYEQSAYSEIKEILKKILQTSCPEENKS